MLLYITALLNTNWVKYSNNNNNCLDTDGGILSQSSVLLFFL